MNEAGLVHDSKELRRLIAGNPDLPIVVLAGEEANSGDWCWMYCTDVDCGIDSILDIRTPYDSEDHVFTDKDDFEQAILDSIPYDDARTQAEIDAFVKSELAKYEPYWKKVIAIYAIN